MNPLARMLFSFSVPTTGCSSQCRHSHFLLWLWEGTESAIWKEWLPFPTCRTCQGAADHVCLRTGSPLLVAPRVATRPQPACSAGGPVPTRGRRRGQVSWRRESKGGACSLINAFMILLNSPCEFGLVFNILRGRPSNLLLLLLSDSKANVDMVWGETWPQSLLRSVTRTTRFIQLLKVYSFKLRNKRRRNFMLVSGVRHEPIFASTTKRSPQEV